MNDWFEPIVVLPRPADDPRPFWSVMIPTYNREPYLPQTIRSVLAQAPGSDRMQIAIVDNATSTFDVAAMVRDLAGDRIEYHRHPANIGAIPNINSCITLSRGQWIHVLHDDDIVLPGFYAAMEDAIAMHPDATLFVCPLLGVDQGGVASSLSNPNEGVNGLINDFLPRQVLANCAPTQSIVVPRTTYEQVGGYAEGLEFTPDWEMAFRAAAAGAAVTLPLPLAAARWHRGSDTSRLIQGDRHLVEMKATIDELARRLPEEQRAKLPARRYVFPADAATYYASVLTTPADRGARLRNLRWANDLDPTPNRLRRYWTALAKSKLGTLAGPARR
jgi:glycosyltransferase involved in cell wall biosynthesis